MATTNAKLAHGKNTTKSRSRQRRGGTTPIAAYAGIRPCAIWIIINENFLTDPFTNREWVATWLPEDGTSNSFSRSVEFVPVDKRNGALTGERVEFLGSQIQGRAMNGHIDGFKSNCVS